MTIKISVIIACFNERNTINKIIDKIIKLNKFNSEIIVIDDFSTDGSREFLKDISKDKIQHLILNDKNYGKGYSIRQGIKKATHDIILIQDADLEYDPSDYEKLIKPMIEDKADVVYGSRFIGSDEKRVLYFWHSQGNKLLTLLSNIFTNLNLTDMECCYKVFKSEIIKNLELEENKFGFEPEVTAKISKMGLRIYEVGVKYYGRKYSEGKKITWRDGFNAIKCIIKYNLKK
ncbi:glycosyltransferase family 2 protein [Candidatus Pelagibacter sp.]|nr:glycosyltransferase family 2 protein [Candidatus Pelagibacter sp.]|tara:strand:+ start:163 stop:858 length:696 start_codon:yes stop_codon:yes gene_type:complete